jgi:hypothetical protein
METHSSSSNLTHTLQEQEELLNAITNHPKVLVPSLVTKMSLLVLPPNSRLLLLNNQSLLPSKPIKWLSNHIPVESSLLDVVPDSTTVSSPSDTEPLTDKSTLSSKTPGDQAGEMKVTLESVFPTTLAVSSTLLLTQVHEMHEACIIKYYNKLS